MNEFQLIRESALKLAIEADKSSGSLTGAELVQNARAIEAYLVEEQLDEVYRFAGWLTSRDFEITASAHHDAAPWAEACAEYIAQRKP